MNEKDYGNTLGSLEAAYGRHLRNFLWKQICHGDPQRVQESLEELASCLETRLGLHTSPEQHTWERFRTSSTLHERLNVLFILQLRGASIDTFARAWAQTKDVRIATVEVWRAAGLAVQLTDEPNQSQTKFKTAQPRMSFV